MRNQRLRKIVLSPLKRNSQVLFSGNKTGQTTFGAPQPPEESVKPAKVLRSNSRDVCRKTRGDLMVIRRPTQDNPPTRVEISVHIFWIVSEYRSYNSPPRTTGIQPQQLDLNHPRCSGLWSCCVSSFQKLHRSGIRTLWLSPV